MARIGKVERLGTEGIGKLLAEMSAQTTFSLLVYAIYSITDTYFLSVGVNSLASAAPRWSRVRLAGRMSRVPRTRWPTPS